MSDFPNYEKLLVKLPSIPGVAEEFYGVGYFSENGDFVFILLTPDIMKNAPVRSISATKWKNTEFVSDPIQIIGTIKKLSLES